MPIDRAGPSAPRTDAAALVLLAFPPLFWAGNAVVGHLAAGTIAPMMLNALRWAIAGLLLAPFTWREIASRWSVVRANWFTFASLGVLGMGSYNALQYLALTTSTPTNVTLIGASGPVFGLVVGAIAFGQRLHARAAAGAVVSLAGVAVVLLRGRPSNLATLDFHVGDLFMLAAAATWSLYTWVLRAKRPDLSPMALLTVQIAFGLVFCAASVVVERFGFGVTSTLATPRAAWMLAYVGLVPSVLAYVLWDRGVARAGASVAIFFANLAPVYAALLSAALLHERPQPYHGVGLLLILAGIALAR